MTGPVSYVHIWRAATGGGRPVDYLRWLAAMWEHYRTATHDGLTLEARLAGSDVNPRCIASHMREPFKEWLVGKFNSPMQPEGNPDK